MSTDSQNHEFELNKLEFEKALDLRKFEIDNFWKRGWFFGALLLALLSAYFSNKSTVTIYISFLALLVSLLQSLMNRGSKYWQERWEYVTKNRESQLGIDLTKTEKYEYERYYIDASILSKGENFLTVGRRFSVSKLAFLVWDLLTLSCFLLWLNELLETFPLNFCSEFSSYSKICIFHLVLIIYILLFWWAGICGGKEGKVYEKFRKSKGGMNKPPKDFKDMMRYTSDSNDYIHNKRLAKKP